MTLAMRRSSSVNCQLQSWKVAGPGEGSNMTDRKDFPIRESLLQNGGYIPCRYIQK